MGMLSEFREFAMKGNVVDLAVGVIVGAAFGKIVSSLVDNVLMPPIGYVIGGLDFKNLSVGLPVPTGDPVLIKYGLFVQSIIDFVIIAFVLFIVIKAMNEMQKRMVAQKAAAPPPPPPQSEVYLKEIRDLLAKK